MSGPRRRRRRRRKPRTTQQDTAQAARRQPSPEQTGPEPEAKQGTRRSRRRRRRRPATRQTAPQTMEDIVRAERERVLRGPRTAPADGQRLEEIVGELQSKWGVPQYPQEYRITLKVAEERNGRGERATLVEEKSEVADEQEWPEEATAGSVRREKAPAAPRVGGEPGAKRERARRRSRRRRPKEG
jgi:hypothetical protein